MEQFGNEYRTIDLDNFLGPVSDENIFRNKGFLLTATIPIKTMKHDEQVGVHFLFMTDTFDNLQNPPFFLSAAKQRQ